MDPPFFKELTCFVSRFTTTFVAGVAQLAECRSPKPKVAGSSPVAGATTGQFQRKLTFLFPFKKRGNDIPLSN